MTDSGRGTEALFVGPVTKTFAGNRALDSVSLSLEGGRVHALLGGNGSGKSTLIKVLAGVEQADHDSIIRVGGRESTLHQWSALEARAMGLRFVHQDLALFPELSVTENLLMQPKIDAAVRGWVSWHRWHARAQRILDEFGVEVSGKALVSSLTAVQRVQVAAARALNDVDAGAQAVIVLDEPTAYLPPREADQLLDSIRGYADRGAAVMIVTHRLGEVVSICNDVTVLRQGRVVAQRELGATSEDDLSFLITNERVTDTARMRIARGADTVSRLSVAAPEDAFRIDLDRGEVVGVVDAGGFTARSLVRGLAGVAELHGTAILDGDAYQPKSPTEAIAGGAVLVPGERLDEAAFPGLSLAANTTIVRQASFAQWGFVKAADERAAADEVIDRFGITPPSRDLDIVGYSGGNQQKVMVGRSLAIDPRLLLLEEPTQGVDVSARRQIWERILDLADAGGSVLVLSSDFQELASRCDRVLVFSHGSIVASLEHDDLTQAAIESAVHVA